MATPARFSAPRSFIDTELMEALSDELRVRIFAYLCLHAAGSKEIAAALMVSESAVRYRLEHLREGGWIGDDPSIRQRGRHYRAIRSMIIPLGAWGRLPDLARHKLAAHMLRHLYADIGAATAVGHSSRPGIHASLTPMVVDEIGSKDVRRVLERALRELAVVQKESDDRVEAGVTAIRLASRTVGLLDFESSRDPAEGDRASATMRLDL